MDLSSPIDASIFQGEKGTATMSITNNRLLRNWLRAHGVTISHYWVLGELRLQSLHNSSIVQKAVETSWVWGRDLEIDEQDAVDAISDLMANRLIQEVTPANLENIARTLESPRGVIAPRDLLLPELAGKPTPSVRLGAAGLPAIHSDVARLVCQRPALCRQRVDLR